MSYDAQIRIFGKVSDPEAMWNLVHDAVDECRTNYQDPIDEDMFFSMLQDADNEGGPLTFTRSLSAGVFENVTAACRAAGLSYLVNYCGSRSDDFTAGFSWRPGLEDDFHFGMDGQEPSLRIEDMRKASDEGIEGVVTLVAAFTFATLIGKIEIEPGFIEVVSGSKMEPSTFGR